MIEKTCSLCLGKGNLVINPCKNCNGEGRVQREKILIINIPAGINSGSKIRIPKEGEAGICGANNGDLYIYIEIKKHQFFKRIQNDLHCYIPIKMTTAILGGVVEIPTLDGKITKVAIPPGTQSGEKLRLKNKGMIIIRSIKYGDLYVETKIELPIKISDQQKKLIVEFEKKSETGSNPQTESFFNKVKNFVKDISR